MSVALRRPSDTVDAEILDGRYRLGERIGRGAFADVIEATHVFTGQRLAIKRWRLPTDDAEDAARWKREILAHTSIMHPVAVAITDAGLDGRRRPYTVMERLEGEDLQTRLTRGPLSLDEALDVFEQLLDGLAAAHGAGILHRDLKPGNVFLERLASGAARVRLLDFGFALPLNRELTRITAEGFAIGTVHYMAPEQASAHDDLGAAADVWAIGVMLYECLSGRLPFDGRTLEDVLGAIARAKPVPIDQVGPHVPGVMGAVVTKCLAPSPADRYATATILRDAWAAVRATHDTWAYRSLEDGAPDTRTLAAAMGAPMPAYPRAVPPIAPRENDPLFPVTRSSPLASAPRKTGPHDPPSDRTVGTSRTGAGPCTSPGAARLTPRPVSAGVAPAAPPSRPVLPSVLVFVAAALTIGALALLAARDRLVVPVLSGNLDEVGDIILDHFWTPVVNAGVSICFVLVLLMSAGGAFLTMTARRRR